MTSFKTLNVIYNIYNIYNAFNVIYNIYNIYNAFNSFIILNIQFIYSIIIYSLLREIRRKH